MIVVCHVHSLRYRLQQRPPPATSTDFDCVGLAVVSRLAWLVLGVGLLVGCVVWVVVGVILVCVGRRGVGSIVERNSYEIGSR